MMSRLQRQIFSKAHNSVPYGQVGQPRFHTRLASSCSVREIGKRIPFMVLVIRLVSIDPLDQHRLVLSKSLALVIRQVPQPAKKCLVLLSTLLDDLRLDHVAIGRQCGWHGRGSE